jgi:hypothetical protein
MHGQHLLHGPAHCGSSHTCNTFIVWFILLRRISCKIAGTCMGNIHFMDLRMVADADGSINSGAAGGAAAAAVGDGSSGSIAEQLSCSIIKTVEAHSKGGMSVLAAHPTAPLLATGTTSQVVKVWTDAGDVVSAMTAVQ